MTKNVLTDGNIKYQFDKNGYYPFPTHIINLPAGWSCPWAEACLTKADRDTGKLVQRPDSIPITPSGVETFVCYAARGERYPSVRDARWANFEAMKQSVREGRTFFVPPTATHVRIHGSGDFFSQAYLDLWLETVRQHPDVRFWAFTKSVRYLVERLDEIPPNLSITTSVGGKDDELIAKHDLKTATVFYDIDDVPEDMFIDVDDYEAAFSERPSFALLENLSNKKQTENEDIEAHNKRASELTGLEFHSILR